MLRLKELAIDLGGGVKLEMVLIPAGEFLMGSPDSDNNARSNEKPQHRVRITKPFCVGKYLVTQEQWEAVMGNNPSLGVKGPKNPVETVTWNDCQKFLEKLNTKIGTQRGKFVLPTEAQWEYACRAGSTAHYCFGDDEARLGEYAWYSDNSGRETHPVGEKKPNAWGLYDIHGNVWEWCQDWYDGGYYAKSPADDPTGPAAGSIADHVGPNRVIRGGSRHLDGGDCRSASRINGAPWQPASFLGLRVSLVPAVGPGGETNSSPKELTVDLKEPQPSEQGKARQTAGAGGKTDSSPTELTVGLGKGIKLEMVSIPAGEFMMGSPDSDKDALSNEKPQHPVRITKPFYLGKYLVTQEQWEAVMGNNPKRLQGPEEPGGNR